MAGSLTPVEDWPRDHCLYCGFEIALSPLDDLWHQVIHGSNALGDTVMVSGVTCAPSPHGSGTHTSIPRMQDAEAVEKWLRS